VNFGPRSPLDIGWQRRPLRDRGRFRDDGVGFDKKIVVNRAAGAPYQVSLLQNVSSGTHLDSSLLPTSTMPYQYDAYGNATEVGVVSSDGYSKSTDNTFINDTTNWLLGRLTKSAVTSQAPARLGKLCTQPWGGTMGDGQSITAYLTANPAVGQDCSAETRTCNNGTLSGSHSQRACAPLGCALPWGGTIANGQSVTAYLAAIAPVGQACSAQTRACSLGGVKGKLHSADLLDGLCVALGRCCQ